MSEFVECLTSKVNNKRAVIAHEHDQCPFRPSYVLQTRRLSAQWLNKLQSDKANVGVVLCLATEFDEFSRIAIRSPENRARCCREASQRSLCEQQQFAVDREVLENVVQMSEFESTGYYCSGVESAINCRQVGLSDGARTGIDASSDC